MKTKFSNVDSESCSAWLDVLMKLVEFIVNLVKNNKKSDNQSLNS